MVSGSQQDNKPLAHGVSLIQTVTQSLNSESHRHAPSADEQLSQNAGYIAPSCSWNIV